MDLAELERLLGEWRGYLTGNTGATERSAGFITGVATCADQMEAVLVRMRAVTPGSGALAAPCPSCGAAAGELCRMGTSSTASSGMVAFHASRSPQEG